MFRIWGGLFYQPRHQVDEIAGTMAAVELGRQYALPRVLHRARRAGEREDIGAARDHGAGRSEEHTSELQSLMRISYAVFCLKKTTTHNNVIIIAQHN